MKKLLLFLLMLALLTPTALAAIGPAPRSATPEPTVAPAPTPLEPLYPEFDYDAAMADPDAYIGEWYTLNGTVNMYHEYEGVNDDGSHNSLVYVFLNGDADKQIVIMYQRPDEEPQPKPHETISCYGNYYKQYEQHLRIGGYITMPMFGTFYIVIL